MDFKSHLDGIVQQNEQLEVEPNVILIKFQSQTTIPPSLAQNTSRILLKNLTDLWSSISLISDTGSLK